MTLFFVLWALVYILSGDPLPITHTVGYHAVGSTHIAVRDVTISGAFGVRFRERGIVIASKQDVFVTRAIGWENRALVIAEPLPFAISDKEPATVSTRRIATPVATFISRVGLRRYPATSSRVIAYTVPGMTKEALRATHEWVKIAIRPQSDGWIREEKALSVEESGGVMSASFAEGNSVHRDYGVDDVDVVWEGRVYRKAYEARPDGTTRYRLLCQNPLGERREYDVDEKTWRSIGETDAIAERPGKNIVKLTAPIAYTKSAPPYEVIERVGKWLRIQLEDQGWARRQDCVLDVRYQYALSRRQIVSRWLLRTPFVGKRLADAVLLVYRFRYLGRDRR